MHGCMPGNLILNNYWDEKNIFITFFYLNWDTVSFSINFPDITMMSCANILYKSIYKTCHVTSVSIS